MTRVAARFRLFASQWEEAGSLPDVRCAHDRKSFVRNEGAQWGGDVRLLDVQGGAELFIWSGSGRRIGVLVDLSELRGWAGRMENHGRAGFGAA